MVKVVRHLPYGLILGASFCYQNQSATSSRKEKGPDLIHLRNGYIFGPQRLPTYLDTSHHVPRTHHTRRSITTVTTTYRTPTPVNHCLASGSENIRVQIQTHRAVEHTIHGWHDARRSNRPRGEQVPARSRPCK